MREGDAITKFKPNRGGDKDLMIESNMYHGIGFGGEAKSKQCPMLISNI